MSPQLLITAIILYILSLAICLILTLSSRKLNTRVLQFLIALHFILAGCIVLFYLLKKENTAVNLLTVVAVTLAVSISGWSTRNNVIAKPFRIYFGMYMLSIFMFIYSPGLLFYTISGKASDFHKEQELLLKGNYYLVEQQSLLNSQSSRPRYKVIRKYGLYMKTIKRDLDFGLRIDTAILLSLSTDSIHIRAYHRNVNDSIDIRFSPGISTHEITHKTKS